MKKYLILIGIILGCLYLSGKSEAVLFTEEEILKQTKIIKEGGRKFLIINADDFGLSSNTNRGVIETFLQGILTSATVMMPTPYVDEVAEFQKKYPQADIGVHLTLTSEWKNYRWGPLSSKEKVPSLLESGTPYLWPDAISVIKYVNPEEAKIEISAQIELAKKLGILITHLDCHMGWGYLSDELSDVVFPHLIENRFPYREVSPKRVRKLKREGIKVIDNLIMTVQGSTFEELKKSFISHLKKLPLGISEVFFHPAYPDKDIVGGWEKRDWERKLLLDEEVKQVIKDEDIILIGYRPLQVLSR